MGYFYFYFYFIVENIFIINSSIHIWIKWNKEIIKTIDDEEKNKKKTCLLPLKISSSTWIQFHFCVLHWDCQCCEMNEILAFVLYCVALAVLCARFLLTKLDIVCRFYSIARHFMTWHTRFASDLKLRKSENKTTALQK